MLSRGRSPTSLHAFDLTPAMLDRFRAKLARRGIDDVETAQANVLALDDLPQAWTGYDLIVTASMLEYVPRERFADALRGLRSRLREGGHLVLFITRRNWLTRLMIGRWWQSNLYGAAELREAFSRAGFSAFAFRDFPLAARHLVLWGYAVEALR
jgi:cyclopropane fatty-acyl-phospholipid synthase-like methyltransferase